MGPYDEPVWHKNLMTSPLFTLKFIYFEKNTKFCKISTAALTNTTKDKSTEEISQNCVVFSEYMNFKIYIDLNVYAMALEIVPQCMRVIRFESDELVRGKKN